MRLKKVVSIYILVYLLVSLPDMLGIGYVVDWIPEATVFQKISSFIIYGLIENFLYKTIIAIVVVIGVYVKSKLLNS